MKKISKKRLEEIIVEEFSRLKLENPLTELNPSHDKKGRFTKRGVAGNTYSLTKNAEEEIGNSPDLKVQRGKETSSGKVQSKFGMNTGSPAKQCGRKTIQGDEKVITRSCKHYPKNYWDKLDEIVSALHLEEGKGQSVCDKCIQQFLVRIRTANAALNNAAKGKVDKPLDETEKKSHYQGSPIEDDKERKTDKRKKAERTKKWRRHIGAYIEPFSQGEKALLNTNSLWETWDAFRTSCSTPDEP